MKSDKTNILKINPLARISNPCQEEFYVRRNTSAVTLAMSKMLNYSKENWGK
jgi:hypothetical protein